MTQKLTARLPNQVELLEAEAKGKRCLLCKSEPTVAFNQGYFLRCKCYPEKPKLISIPSPEGERLGEMVNRALAERPDRPPLSIEEVRQFISPKATQQEAYIFLRFCQSQGLNPFINDAYLIKYDETSRAAIVVGIQAYLRRAAQNPDFAGYRAGLVVKRNEQILEVEGALAYPNDVLLGAWCVVERHNWKNPLKHTVSRQEYDKKQSMWLTMPATMLVKVATVQTLRRAIPEVSSLESAELPIEVGPDEMPRLAAPRTEAAPQPSGELPTNLCPEHRTTWVEGKFGPYHFTGPKGKDGKNESCTPGKAFISFTDKLGWDNPGRTAFLASKGIQKWADLTGPQQVDILAEVVRLNSPTAETPAQATEGG